MKKNDLKKLLDLTSLKTKISSMKGILNTYTPDNLIDSTHRNWIRDELSKWKSSLIERIEEIKK